MLSIYTYGSPVLRKTGSEITEFDDELRAFIREMELSMKENDGVGLAAPQVGSSIQLAVISEHGDGENPYVIINPVVTEQSDEKETDQEGCLSIPGINMDVTRPAVVTVEALDEYGKPYKIENASGLLARALQHEIDHLNGILFVDRVSPVNRTMISGKLKKLAKSSREPK